MGSETVRYISVSVAAYLLGSIPFGYLAGRIAGIDIRKHGSGNIGATNVLRVLGRTYGYPVFVFDTLKGFAAVRLGLYLANYNAGYKLGVVAAICAVLGHSFPMWLGFRGGKGVATSAGAYFGLLPAEMVIALLVWIITFSLFRFVSLASLLAAVAVPLSLWLLAPVTSDRRLLFAFTIVVTLLVIGRHRSNIRRLLCGTEPSFQPK
jgi:acyl phosphate:glycerol-3-phosphate acyltransferase